MLPPQWLPSLKSKFEQTLNNEGHPDQSDAAFCSDLWYTLTSFQAAA